MKQTKELLQKELEETRVLLKHAETVAQDTLRLDEAQRKELTIALGKGFTVVRPHMEFGGYREEREDKTQPLSWSQIYVAIGRLKEVEGRLGIADYIEHTKARGNAVIEKLEQRAARMEEEDPEGPTRRRY